MTLSKEFPRGGEELRQLLDEPQPQEPRTSGNVKDIYIGEEEVMKVSFNLSCLSYPDSWSNESPEDRIETLESTGIPYPETEIEYFDLENIKRTVDDENTHNSYNQRNPVVFQERCEVLSNPSFEELDEVLTITDKATENGVCFPDNSPTNWGYKNGNLVRIDVADAFSVTEMEPGQTAIPEQTDEFASGWASRMNEDKESIEEYVRAKSISYE